MSYGTLHCHKGKVYLMEVSSFTDYEDVTRHSDMHISISQKLDNNDKYRPVGACRASALLRWDSDKEAYKDMLKLGADSHDALFSFAIDYYNIGATL